jgi:hypothetical protein
MTNWRRTQIAWEQQQSGRITNFAQVLGLPAIQGNNEMEIEEANAMRLRMIEELLVLVSDFEEGVEGALFDWMVRHTDAEWWIRNHSVEAIQISHLVGFAGLADLMMYEAEAVQYGADIERERYPNYPDDWEFLIDLGMQGRYATFICDDNGYRDVDDRHIFYRLHAIHDSEESARAEIRRYPELSLWTPERSAVSERWARDRKMIPLSEIAMSMR